MAICYYPRARKRGRARWWAAYNRCGSRARFFDCGRCCSSCLGSVAGQTGHGSDDLSSPDTIRVIIRLLMTLTRARGRNEFELAAMHSINTLPPRDANSTLIRQPDDRIGCSENARAAWRARDTLLRRFTIDHVKVILRRASRPACPCCPPSHPRPKEDRVPTSRRRVAGRAGGRRTRTRGNLDHPSFGLIITVFRFGAFCPRREDPPAHDLRYRGVAHPARSYTHEYAYIRHRRKYEGKKRVSFTRERRPAARGRGEGAAEGTRGREAGQSVGL